MAIPFQNENLLQNTQKVLAKREIPSFKAATFGEGTDWKRKSKMEIWFENGVGRGCFGTKSEENKINIEDIEAKPPLFGANNQISLKKIDL